MPEKFLISSICNDLPFLHTILHKISIITPILIFKEFYESPSRIWMSHFLEESQEKNEVIEKSKAEIDDDEEIANNWKLKHISQTEIWSHQFIDSFRKLHSDRKEAFTCWNTEKNCRENNYGTRIDYIFTDINMTSYLTSCDIQPDVMGSDHCPVRAEYSEVIGVPNSKPPSFCTKYFPEFSGNQQKLSAYFTAKAPGEKRKSDSSSDNFDANQSKKKKVATKTQSSISNFFVKSQTKRSDDTNKEKTEMTCVETSLKEAVVNKFGGGRPQLVGGANEVEKRMKAASAWKAMMKGPPQPPTCKGHNEVCVLRTVKKKGPNLGRQFWCCARGEGRSDDPKARCNYFEWVK